MFIWKQQAVFKAVQNLVQSNQLRMNHNSTAIQIFDLYTKIRKIKFKIVKVSLENKSLTKGRLKWDFTLHLKVSNLEWTQLRFFIKIKSAQRIKWIDMNTICFPFAE